MSNIENTHPTPTPTPIPTPFPDLDQIVTADANTTTTTTNIPLVQSLVNVNMPTKYGHFNLILFKHLDNDQDHLALVKGTWNHNEPIPVRIHSSCITGDIFASCRCDCGDQLHKAMQIIDHHGKGIILYMNQEGRGIGLLNKLKAYNLQEQGLDTVQANIALGFKPDQRDYTISAHILRHLDVQSILLISNNPNKHNSLIQHGFHIQHTIPIQIQSNPFNISYLITKRDKMQHTLHSL